MDSENFRNYVMVSIPLRGKRIKTDVVKISLGLIQIVSIPLRGKRIKTNNGNHQPTVNRKVSIPLRGKRIKTAIL